MKKTLLSLITFALLISTFAMAQEHTTLNDNITKPKIRHSLSVNTASVYRRLLKIATDSTTLNEQFMYRLHLSPTRAFRLGFGGSYNTVNDKLENFLDSKVLMTKSLNMRLGYEINRKFSNKWAVFYGADAICFLKNTTLTNDSGFDKVSIITTNNSLGVSTFIGLKYNFNDRLAIYSESAIYYLINRNVRVADFEKFPEFNDTKDRNTTQKINYFLPTGLYLQYTF